MSTRAQSLSAWHTPALSLRFIQVWRRNFLVWRKMAIPSMAGNLADPAFYMLGLGYGLGALLPRIDDMSYLTYLAGGTVCFSILNSASFEAMYSAFSRMSLQKTWDAILNTPMILDDVLLGELAWAASKSFLSGCAILLVAWLLGVASMPMSLWVLPLALLIGFCFAGMALVMTAIAPSFDFFMYYMTLVMTPMTLICGVFFPVEQLPAALQSVAAVLPLTHAIELVRPLLVGKAPADIAQHLAVLIGYGAAGFMIALTLLRRRLLK